MPCSVEHLLGHPLDVLQVGEVRTVDVGVPPASSISSLVSSSFSGVRATSSTVAPASARLDRRRLADPRGSAGDHHRLAADRAREGAVLEQVGVEVALPVVPEPVGVARQRRDADACALAAPAGCWSSRRGRVVDVDEDRAGDPEVGEHLVGDPLHRGQHLDRRADLLGDDVEHLRVDPHRRLGRVGRAGEEVDDLAGAERVRGQSGGRPCRRGRPVCAMWSIALATKSTGTRLISRPSIPIPGIHGGSRLRARWSSLKK